jgi:hypothetical protein
MVRWVDLTLTGASAREARRNAALVVRGSYEATVLSQPETNATGKGQTPWVEVMSIT